MVRRESRTAKGHGLSGRGARAALLLRSFFLQAVWNPRGMQNVGFCFTMLPLLGRWRDDPEGRRAFLTRHLGFFNTNPVLASYAIGAAASAELADAPEQALEVKRSLGGPLGMAGDSLFWGSLRPLSALVGVALAAQARAWAPFALLALYNVPHLYFRARGIASGGERGGAASSEVLGPAFRRGVALVRAAASFAAGLVLAFAMWGTARVDPGRAAVGLGLFALAYVAVRLRVPATVIGLAAAGGVMLMVFGNGGGTG
jgi:PTS system mannose-specific IID component